MAYEAEKRIYMTSAPRCDILRWLCMNSNRYNCDLNCRTLGSSRNKWESSSNVLRQVSEDLWGILLKQLKEKKKVMFVFLLSLWVLESWSIIIIKVSMLCNIRLTTVSPPKGCYKVSLVKLKEHMLHASSVSTLSREKSTGLFYSRRWRCPY